MAQSKPETGPTPSSDDLAPAQRGEKDTDLKSVDMTQGSVAGHLRRFVVPMAIGITASMMVGLIDMYWLGKLGVTAQGAATLGFPVGFAAFSVAIGLSAGAVAAVGPAVARGNQEELRTLATNALLLGFVSAVVVAVIGVLSAGVIFRAMGAEGELLELAVLYMRIWFFGMVFIAAPVIGSAILRAVGQAVLPGVMMAMTAVVNMALDPLFIFGWGPVPAMGVGGAALATVLANAVGMALIGYLLVVRQRLVSVKLAPWPVIREHWRRVAHVGAPAAFSNMVNPLSTALVSAIFTRINEQALAGFGISSRIEMFVTIPLFALSAAIAPVVGQNFGAGRMDRVRETFRECFRFAVAYSVVMAAVLALTGGWLSGLFTDNADVRGFATAALLIMPITMWGYGATFIASAGLNGLSRPTPGVIMTVGRSALLLTPGAMVGAWIGGGVGAFVGMAIANVVVGAVVIAWVLTRALPPQAAIAVIPRPAERAATKTGEPQEPAL